MYFLERVTFFFCCHLAQTSRCTLGFEAPRRVHSKLRRLTTPRGHHPRHSTGHLQNVIAEYHGPYELLSLLPLHRQCIWTEKPPDVFFSDSVIFLRVRNDTTYFNSEPSMRAHVELWWPTISRDAYVWYTTGCSSTVCMDIVVSMQRCCSRRLRSNRQRIPS